MNHVVSGVRFQLYSLRRTRKTATLICYQVGSERKRVTFEGGLAAAQRHCRHLARTVTGGDAALQLTPLENRVWAVCKESAAKLGRAPDAIIRDYLEAVRVLDGTGTVIEACRAWQRQHGTALASITLSALVSELKQHLEQKRREKVTIASLDSILRPLVVAFGETTVASITTRELERYLGTLKLAPRTLNNHRAGIVRLWNYARGRYLPDAPTAAGAIEEFSQPDRGAIGIFRPWEFRAVLDGLADMAARCQSALKQKRALGLLRTVFLAGFTGARTVELCRMESSAIHTGAASDAFPHGYVEIKKGVAKRHRTAARRLIPIQPNLAKWIERFPFPDGPVSPYPIESSFTRALSRAIAQINRARVRLQLPAIGRPENGCRHSYASYRLPILKSAAALAIEMNNSPAEIEQNYHELAPPADVAAWWKIEPAENVVPFQVLAEG